MGRWTDLATWRGPTPNQGGPMREYRGLVIHIAAGYFEGTIAWQLNDSSNVSSHFVVGRDGRRAQVVDTGVTAWTQSDGNGKWLSSENEGFLLGDRRHHDDWHLLSAPMIEANAQLFARAHLEYGVPLQLATSPTGLGLGYHSMGAESGYNWGHSACPGEPIKAQLPQVLARAIEIVNGDDPMRTVLVKANGGDGKVFLSNGLMRVHVANYTETDKAADDATVLRDSVWVAGRGILNSLVDTAVRTVDDLDAFGLEMPGDFADRFGVMEDRIRQLTAPGQVDVAALAEALKPHMAAAAEVAVAGVINRTKLAAGPAT